MIFIDLTMILRTFFYICGIHMKKLIPTLVFLMSVLYGHGQVEHDKALHYLGGNLYGLAGAGIAKQISDGNRFWTFAGAIGGATLIGLGKEAVDSGQRENGWDNDDLLATILGGATVGLTIDIFTDHKGRRKQKLRESLNSSEAFQQNHDSFQKIFVEQDKFMPTLTSLGVSKNILEGLQ